MNILKYKEYQFNAIVFFFCFLITAAWTLFALIAVFAKEEGTLGDGLFVNFAAFTFPLAAFPSSLLIWILPEAYFVGLFINVILYAFVFERVITIGLNNIKHYKNPEMKEEKTWKHVKTIVDGEKFEINGLNIWHFKWQGTGEYVTIKDPLYGQSYSFEIFEIKNDNVTILFAAGEFSNGIYGIFQKE